MVWTVGGWLWALAPLTQLASYALLVHSVPNERWHMHRFPVVLAHVGGSALWLLLYAQSGEPSLLLPFATCYGANAAIMGLMRLRAHVPDITERDAISIATARGLVVVVLPVLVLVGSDGRRCPRPGRLPAGDLRRDGRLRPTAAGSRRRADRRCALDTPGADRRGGIDDRDRRPLQLDAATGRSFPAAVTMPIPVR